MRLHSEPLVMSDLRAMHFCVCIEVIVFTLFATINSGGIMFWSCLSSCLSVYLSVNTFCDEPSLFSEGMAMKLARNIHHVSRKSQKGFCGQWSKVKVILNFIYGNL